jgi:hypothetical protein
MTVVAVNQGPQSVSDDTGVTKQTRKERIKHFAVVAAKISVVATVALAWLAAAGAIAYFSGPLFAAGFLGVAAGLGVCAAAIGLGVGGAGIASSKARNMTKDTPHNLKDCGVHLIRSVAFAALGAVDCTIGVPLRCISAVSGFVSKYYEKGANYASARI